MIPTRTTCLRHPEREILTRVCATAVRDGLDPESNVCACCDECVALCLATPHGHGGTPAEEWRDGRCLICGIAVDGH